MPYYEWPRHLKSLRSSTNGWPSRSNGLMFLADGWPSCSDAWQTACKQKAVSVRFRVEGHKWKGPLDINWQETLYMLKFLEVLHASHYIIKYIMLKFWAFESKLCLHPTRCEKAALSFTIMDSTKVNLVQFRYKYLP